METSSNKHKHITHTNYHIQKTKPQTHTCSNKITITYRLKHTHPLIQPYVITHKYTFTHTHTHIHMYQCTQTHL